MRQTESFHIPIPNGRSVGPDQSPAPRSASGPAAITVDYEAYAHFLDGSELSEDQKRAFLQALWALVCEFVALGFDVHPVQQAQDACEQLPRNRTNPPYSDADAVGCRGSFLPTEFSNAAGGAVPQVAERIQE